MTVFPFQRRKERKKLEKQEQKQVSSDFFESFCLQLCYCPVDGCAIHCGFTIFLYGHSAKLWIMVKSKVERRFLWSQTLSSRTQHGAAQGTVIGLRLQHMT